MAKKVTNKTAKSVEPEAVEIATVENENVEEVKSGVVVDNVNAVEKDENMTEQVEDMIKVNCDIEGTPDTEEFVDEMDKASDEVVDVFEGQDKIIENTINELPEDIDEVVPVIDEVIVKEPENVVKTVQNNRRLNLGRGFNFSWNGVSY